MIKYIIGSILSSYYKPINKFLENPWGSQLDTFNYLISHGRRTFFGQKYNFDKIKTPEDFKKYVPVMGYDDLKPYLDIMINEKKQIINQIMMIHQVIQVIKKHLQ